MRRVSNNITLLLKIFIPTFWFVFFTSLLVAIFLLDPDRIPLLSSWQFRTGYVLIYVLFALILYFTAMKLLRVEFGPEKFTVSNYFKTYAYQYQDIAEIKETNYLVFRLITITLRSSGSLGKRIHFIPSYKNYEDFIRDYPELFSHLME